VRLKYLNRAIEFQKLMLQGGGHYLCSPGYGPPHL
jgi:hypothetical protein